MTQADMTQTAPLRPTLPEQTRGPLAARLMTGLSRRLTPPPKNAASRPVVHRAGRQRLVHWRVAPDTWRRGHCLRIGMIADPHVGPPNLGLDRLATIVRLLNDAEPDLVALLGDYGADHLLAWSAPSKAEIAGILRNLRAPLGVYAILGNHDWAQDRRARAARRGPTETHDAFRQAGIPVLENEAVRLDTERGAFWIAGLGDQLAFAPPFYRGTERVGIDDLPGTLAQVTDDAPMILLAHEPDIFPQVPARVALTLSGHMHAGQIRVFGRSPLLPSRFGARYVYGHVEETGRHLVVSGGLGYSGFPIRIGAPPEITLVELE